MSGSFRNSRSPENWQPGQDYWIYLPNSLSDFLPARTLNHRGRTGDPWFLVEERLIGVPNRGLARFPPPPPSRPPPVPLLLIGDTYPRAEPNSPLTYYEPWADPRPREDDSRLSLEEQKQAVNKLRKRLYSPHINNIFKRISNKSSISSNSSSSSSSSSSSTGGFNQDDLGKRCVICLEDFETKQFVTMTPCNHMFHEECIVPWVKSQGKCPVCRYVIAEKSPPQLSRNDAVPWRGGAGRNQIF